MQRLKYMPQIDDVGKAAHNFILFFCISGHAFFYFTFLCQFMKFIFCLRCDYLFKKLASASVWRTAPFPHFSPFRERERDPAAARTFGLFGVIAIVVSVGSSGGGGGGR